MGNDAGERVSRKKRNRLILFTLAVVAVGFLVFFLKGRYVSDTLKGIIIPELETATGQKVEAPHISVNILPLFIEAKNMKVSDTSGNAVVNTKKVKGYISLSGIFNRQLILQRLVIEEPSLVSDNRQLDEIIRHVRAYLEQERDLPFKVKIKVVEVVQGSVYLKDEELKGRAGIKGLSGEYIIGDNRRLKASVKELTIDKQDWPKIKCDINTSVVFKKDRIEIKQLKIGAYGSRFTGAGYYAGGKGTFTAGIDLIVDSVKRMFHLVQKGDGRISAKGEIWLGKYEAWPPTIKTPQQGFPLKGLKDVFLNLKIGGDFYLQTLMELLKVKEKLVGLVDFQGTITGRLNDISGKGKARMRKGNLYGVDIDEVICDVIYKDGVMDFKNGLGHLYNGTADADASIKLPIVDFFTVNVKFHSADSGPVLNLIGWDPGIPPGKVDGELSSSGRAFGPDGRFVYKALGPEQRAGLKGYRTPVDDVLNRIKDIKGNFSMREDILSLTNLQLGTALSKADANGTLDLAGKTLNLKSRIHTENVSDFALPYYREIKGRGGFTGDVKGTFEDPRIDGRFTLASGIIEGYKSDRVISDMSYRKNLLEIREAVFRSSGEEHTIKGRIAFPEAGYLFDLSKPVYDLRASVRNAEFGQAARIFYKDFIATGRLDGDFRIEGRDLDPEVTGKVSVGKASVYKIPFDSGTTALTYSARALSLDKVKIVKGKSVVDGEARFLSGGKFTYTAASEKFPVKDFGLGRLPEDIVLSLQSSGQGTIDNPSLSFNARVAGGSFKGQNIGGGTISASIKNRVIALNAALFNERMKIKGNGRFDETLPWSAEVSMRQGRYDFLASSILKDVPEDLQLNLEGGVSLKGDRNNISASLDIGHVTLSLFGQTFANDSRLQVRMDNRKVSIKTFTVKSGSTSFRLHGGMEIGKEYDISLDGSSSLAPLKGLSKKIGYLKGDADFEFSVTGKWDKPDINGGMNLNNASFGLKDFPSYISSINGYLYIDEDRVVLEKLSGKIGGGDVNISGIVYLQAFTMKRFYLQANFDNITTTFAKEFTVNFGGNLLYRGTADAMSITGDLKINRARYKEMVEWRSWLLASKPKEIPKSEASVFEKAQMNIRVSGGENILIDNNMARMPVRIRGDMILRGTVTGPILFGRLESNEGYVYFRNNEFKIIFASVDFADPNIIKPVVNLTAETMVKGYNIRLSLEGQMDHFNLALSSDPHLDEVDILALLTVGQIGKQLKGLEGGISAGEATAFITGKVQDVIEERMRSITGLDRFQVEPYVSNKTGTVGPQVTVSKRLIGDRLFVTYTNAIGSTEEQIIKLEYLLEKNVSLVGVRDEKGSLGGDIKFRFEFK